MSKTALVTGASSGIGEAIAINLAQAGYTVFGTSRSPRENKHGITFLEMNVDDDESVRLAVDTLLAQSSTIDICVSAAGLGIVGAVEEVPIDVARQVFETNVFGTMRVIQAVLPAMRKQRSGMIINISSIGGMVGLPFRGLYAASKFAVEGLTESLALELAPFNIKATLIQPGGFKTNIAGNRPKAVEINGRPYGKYFDHITAMVAKEVDHAPGPEPVGNLAVRVARKGSPSMRYPVGSFMEKLTPVLRKWLPWGLYSWMIRRFHKL
jgi:NAD(P)-dependent dehydrogenase (short-subunit alcohol dehydrogenase family)